MCFLQKCIDDQINIFSFEYLLNYAYEYPYTLATFYRIWSSSSHFVSQNLENSGINETLHGTQDLSSNPAAMNKTFLIFTTINRSFWRRWGKKEVSNVFNNSKTTINSDDKKWLFLNCSYHFQSLLFRVTFLMLFWHIQRTHVIRGLFPANSIIHNPNMVQNDNFKVKYGLFICEFKIRGPKWWNVSTANNMG